MTTTDQTTAATRALDTLVASGVPTPTVEPVSDPLDAAISLPTCGTLYVRHGVNSSTELLGLAAGYLLAAQTLAAGPPAPEPDPEAEARAAVPDAAVEALHDALVDQQWTPTANDDVRALLVPVFAAVRGAGGCPGHLDDGSDGRVEAYRDGLADARAQFTGGGLIGSDVRKARDVLDRALACDASDREVAEAEALVAALKITELESEPEHAWSPTVGEWVANRDGVGRVLGVSKSGLIVEVLCSDGRSRAYEKSALRPATPSDTGACYPLHATINVGDPDAAVGTEIRTAYGDKMIRNTDGWYVCYTHGNSFAPHAWASLQRTHDAFPATVTAVPA